MEKPNDNMVTPDGRIFIGKKWITLRFGLITLAFLIGAIVSALYGMWVLSVILIVFFGLSGLALVFLIGSKP